MHSVRLTLENAARHIKYGLTVTAQKINTTVCWLNRNITYYCDTYLPHPINIIAKAALRSLPFILLQTLLPFPLRIASVVVIAIYSIATSKMDSAKSRDFPNITELFQNAVVFSSLISAATDTITFVTTGQVISLVYAITNVAVAVITALHTHLAQDIFSRRSAAVHRAAASAVPQT